MSNDSKKPIKTLQDGFLHVSIWENQGSKGKFYNFTISRAYKEGDEYKYTTSFGGEDALPLSRLVDQAYGEIRSLQATATPAAEPAATV